MPFFEKYRLHLRVFDKFYKVVHKYAPDNHYKNKVTYCLQTDGRIYTLNHDVKRIEQKQDDDEQICVLTEGWRYVLHQRRGRSKTNQNDLKR